jgi:hypothetical protein
MPYRDGGNKYVADRVFFERHDAFAFKLMPRAACRVTGGFRVFAKAA